MWTGLAVVGGQRGSRGVGPRGHCARHSRLSGHPFAARRFSEDADCGQCVHCSQCDRYMLRRGRTAGCLLDPPGDSVLCVSLWDGQASVLQRTLYVSEFCECPAVVPAQGGRLGPPEGCDRTARAQYAARRPSPRPPVSAKC